MIYIKYFIIFAYHAYICYVININVFHTLPRFKCKYCPFIIIISYPLQCGVVTVEQVCACYSWVKFATFNDIFNGDGWPQEYSLVGFSPHFFKLSPVLPTFAFPLFRVTQSFLWRLVPLSSYLDCGLVPFSPAFNFVYCKVARKNLVKKWQPYMSDRLYPCSIL